MMTETYTTRTDESKTACTTSNIATGGQVWHILTAHTLDQKWEVDVNTAFGEGTRH